MMAKGVEVTLYDATGAAYASGTDIAVIWFDGDAPPDLGAIKGNSAVATTTAGGVLSLDLDVVTGLDVGEWGFLVCYKLDGTDHKDSPVFASRMQVASMTGTTPLEPLTSFVRNPDWPAQVAPVNGVQKFTGLLAVYDNDSNFVAFQFSGAVTIDWGDGSATEDVAAAVQAQRNLVYANIPGTVVGTSNAVAVTFTDSGDVVNLTAHGYQNGQPISFASITSTTGISTHTTYFVVGRTADTFQISATRGGSALPLTTDGSGTAYVPEYKVAVITVTPQAANNITSMSLQKKHTQSGLQKYNAAWLDVAINSEYLTALEIGASFMPVNLSTLCCVSLGENAVTNFGSAFNDLRVLQSIKLNTASGENFANAFSSCRLLQSVPMFDLSSATDITSMFSGCSSLVTIPLLDTSAVTSFYFVFYNCPSLLVIPQLDTGMVNSFQYTFTSCISLQSIPLLNTSSCSNFSRMFSSCSALRSIPLLDTSSGTNFANMFDNCNALVEVPMLNLDLATSTSSMFFNCYNLAKATLLNPNQSFSVTNCKLSSAALNDIYSNLKTGLTGKVITVTGNYGTTGDNPALVPAGWTVTG